MKLPLNYIETMKALLGAEYDAYLAREYAEAFRRGNGGEGSIFS